MTTRDGSMRTTRAMALLAAAAFLSACGGDDDCREGLSFELPAGQGSGLFAFSGTADGEAFRCEYVVAIEAGEVVTATDLGCEGPASLVIEHHRFDVGVAASVTGVVVPPPVHVEYRVELTDGGGAVPRLEADGSVDPDYGDGCRRATIEAY